MNFAEKPVAALRQRIGHERTAQLR